MSEKLRVISDGTAVGTKVLYGDLDISSDVTCVEWVMDARQSFARALVTFRSSEMEVSSDYLDSLDKTD